MRRPATVRTMTSERGPRFYWRQSEGRCPACGASGPILRLTLGEPHSAGPDRQRSKVERECRTCGLVEPWADYEPGEHWHPDDSGRCFSPDADACANGCAAGGRFMALIPHGAYEAVTLDGGE